uniref:Uncharacterized protein n=1 Tax=viral metagenome TaxID=1070528 RepID=A0A6C0C2Q2_9ZZZZ
MITKKPLNSFFFIFLREFVDFSRFENSQKKKDVGKFFYI